MISEGRYKDQKAIILENDFMKATFLPDFGANMASCIRKEGNKEFLFQRREEKYQTIPYGGDFTKAECSGMDDMFPTIDVCPYDMDPWKGMELPDHGEVWNTKMNVTMGEDSVTFQMSGRELPYTFTKTVKFVADDTLRISYKAENNSDYDLNYLWAGHTMLRGVPGSKYLVPEDCKEGRIMFDFTNKVGKSWDTLTYPVCKLADGTEHDLSTICDWKHDAVKWYFENEMKEGMCGLQHPDGSAFIYHWPADQVPYLGLLEEYYGLYDYDMVIFIEPCTALYDRPDKARANGKGSIIKAHSAAEWYLDVTLK